MTDLIPEGDKPVVATATPGDAGVGSPTPGKTSEDGGGKTDDLQTKLEAALKRADEITEKYERDLRDMKSSLQKGEAERLAEIQDQLTTREAELERIRTQGMNDGERTQYERNQYAKRNEDLEAQLEELQERTAQVEQFQNAKEFFLSNGVPADKLKLDGGVDALSESGWAYLQEELKTLRSKGQAPAAPNAPKAPEVETGQGQVKTAKTWEEVIAKYAQPGEHPMATRERIYREVELRHLPPDVLPD